MATIRARKNKKGISYSAQIRIKQKGEVVYTEAKTFDKKRLAEQWATRREAELQKPGMLEKLRHRGVSVGQVLKWYDEDYNTEKSPFGRTKLEAILALQNMDIADLDALQLTTRQVINHIQWRVRTVSGATAENDITWLRAAFRGARLTRGMPVDEQVINDAAAILRSEKIIHKAQQRNRRPALEELDTLLSHFNKRDVRASINMVDVVLFALFSARRQDEICRIRWSDLDEKRQSVLVREMKHPRKKVDTWVYLTDEAWALIQRQPRVDGDDRIFPLKSKSVSSAFTKACKFLAIEDLRFHDLRHECASWLFETGLDIVRVARVTGHLSWESLRRYTHLQDQKHFNKYENWRWRPLLEQG